jgi:catechol 2,3-dioxygenase-like lactoylglutathione lyase family enzyme
VTAIVPRQRAAVHTTPAAALSTRIQGSGLSRPNATPVERDENDDMEPLAIHHVAINVRNLPEALKFYEGDLGFVRRTDRPDFGFGGAWLDAGGQQLHLLEAEPPASVGQHFAIRVADLDATIAELRAAGHSVSDPSPVGVSRQAFLSDPSGNVLELHEVG